MDIHKQIREIEDEICRIKTAHLIGKIKTDEAKSRINDLEARLLVLIEKLEPYERESYLMRRSGVIIGG